MKIGIITMFYKTLNYGGILQAYALLKALSKLHYQVDQINYSWRKEGFISRKLLKQEHFKSMGSLEKIKKILLYISKKIIHKLHYRRVWCEEEKLNVRRNNFKQFSCQNVSSSYESYNSFNISCIADKYDAFIVGSDQVWSEFSIDKGFSLDYASDDTKKIAYAASGIGKSISFRHAEIFSRILPTFDAISVREKHAVDLLQTMCDKKVKHVCDPVLLLSSFEWDEISFDRIVNDKYIFCYFLGEDKKFRKLAVEFGKKRGLKTVFIPYAKGKYCSADYKIGDYRIIDASPADFISLIKNAEYVFTDSFHACTFSTIYHKQFFVFRRSDTGGIERIKNILELSGAQEHLIDEEEKLNSKYLESVSDVSYVGVDVQIEKFRGSSIEFLKNALKN